MGSRQEISPARLRRDSAHAPTPRAHLPASFCRRKAPAITRCRRSATTARCIKPTTTRVITRLISPHTLCSLDTTSGRFAASSARLKADAIHRTCPSRSDIAVSISCMLNKLHDAFWKEHDVYQHRDFYSADKAAEYCDVRACLSVCQRAYLRTAYPIFFKFSCTWLGLLVALRYVIYFRVYA